MASERALEAACDAIVEYSSDDIGDEAIGKAIDAAFPVMLREKVEALTEGELLSLGTLLESMHYSEAVNVASARAALLRALGVEA